MTTHPEPGAGPRDEWAAQLEDQCGVVHRRDVPTEYMREVTTAARRGKWQRPCRDVFVNHNGPLTPEQRLRVVIKAAPPSSALSGLTAARLGGLKGFDDSAVTVTVPCGTSMPELEELERVVHYSRYLDNRDVQPVLTPRRTRMPRSLLDAAAWAATDIRARSIMLAGVQQRLVTPDHLTEALPRRGPCLRHALILETIDDAEGGVSSVPEKHFDDICSDFGLPVPTRQRVLQRSDGRYYLDADWEEYGLSSEIDGVPHMSVINWDADLDRMNEIVIDHRIVMRFTSYSVRHRRLHVGTTLTRALNSRGWTP